MVDWELTLQVFVGLVTKGQSRVEPQISEMIKTSLCDLVAALMESKGRIAFNNEKAFRNQMLAGVGDSPLCVLCRMLCRMLYALRLSKPSHGSQLTICTTQSKHSSCILCELLWPVAACSSEASPPLSVPAIRRYCGPIVQHVSFVHVLIPLVGGGGCQLMPWAADEVQYVDRRGAALEHGNGAAGPALDDKVAHVMAVLMQGLRLQPQKAEPSPSTGSTGSAASSEKGPIIGGAALNGRSAAAGQSSHRSSLHVESVDEVSPQLQSRQFLTYFDFFSELLGRGWLRSFEQPRARQQQRWRRLRHSVTTALGHMVVANLDVGFAHLLRAVFSGHEVHFSTSGEVRPHACLPCTARHLLGPSVCAMCDSQGVDVCIYVHILSAVYPPPTYHTLTYSHTHTWHWCAAPSC
jgi:hypothetical protein